MNIQFHSPPCIDRSTSCWKWQTWAMVFGGVEKERLALNEIPFGLGTQATGIIRGGEGNLAKVESLSHKKSMRKQIFSARKSWSLHTVYLPFGDLHLVMEHGNVCRQYFRKLDLSTGIVTVDHSIGIVPVSREILPLIPTKPLSCV